MGFWLLLILAIALGGVAATIAIALFERWIPGPVLRAFQRPTGRWFRSSAGLLPGYAVLETIGRRTGEPRQVPVGGRLRGNTFWLVAANGRSSQYVRNIEANPTVRLCLRGRWRAGTAHICPEDDPRRQMLRSNPLNSLFIWLAGHDHLTLKVDLKEAKAGGRKRPCAARGRVSG